MRRMKQIALWLSFLIISLEHLRACGAELRIVTKSEWEGRPATDTTPLAQALPYAVIHHSAGAYCNTPAQCRQQMRNMQHYHMETRHFADIGYNFAIGADGEVYEGRGADVQGAHAGAWNPRSIGIVFIGNYNDYVPTAMQIQRAKELLEHLVSAGNLHSNYVLYGHGQWTSGRLDVCEMPLKSHQLQALFARRREQEHMRIERTAAVSRYYDHWGKVTSRFENWTTPEYYKQADAAVQQKKDKKEKDTLLQQRREKLRKLFADEQRVFESEQKERAKPMSRKIAASTETLQKVEENTRERANIRRKLELEAKLYGKWRHGVDDENAIFESKNNHEVLAKLNWLDKQIEDQLEREKENALAEERQLRLQEEISRTEAAQKERQLIREQEIKEIRGLQETHMKELRSRQAESEELKAVEKRLREYLQCLDKELELLTESSLVTLEPAELTQAYNLKNIKVYIRKRSDVFRDQIRLHISILQRTRDFASKPQTLSDIVAKYEAQMEAEKYTMSQIESWYESEAKYNLKRCEDMWQTQHLERYHELKQLLTAEKSTFSACLNENLDRQTELIDIRDTHLSSIENANFKLKQLIKEQESSFGPTADQLVTDEMTVTTSAPHHLNEKRLNVQQQSAVSAPAAAASASSLPQVTKSFKNLNLDVWQDLPSARGGIDSPRLQSQRLLQVVSAQNAERPKFGRKRVAWT